MSAKLFAIIKLAKLKRGLGAGLAQSDEQVANPG